VCVCVISCGTLAGGVYVCERGRERETECVCVCVCESV
jgi:hypothetical protein